MWFYYTYMSVDNEKKTSQNPKSCSNHIKIAITFKQTLNFKGGSITRYLIVLHLNFSIVNTKSFRIYEIFIAFPPPASLLCKQKLSQEKLLDVILPNTNP